MTLLTLSLYPPAFDNSSKVGITLTEMYPTFQASSGESALAPLPLGPSPSPPLGRSQNTSDDVHFSHEPASVFVNAVSDDLFVLHISLVTGSLRIPLQLVDGGAVWRPDGEARFFQAAPPSLGGISLLPGGSVFGDVFTSDEHLSLALTSREDCHDRTKSCHSVLRTSLATSPDTSAVPTQRPAKNHSHVDPRDIEYKPDVFQSAVSRPERAVEGGPSNTLPPVPPLELRVAVFVEHRAIEFYESVLERLGGRGQLPLLLSHYLAQVAAVFRHPSLGVTVSLTFTEVQLWRDTPGGGGDGRSALDRFCALHAPVQQRAGHRWDVGLLLVGGPLGQHDALGVAQLGTVCGEAAASPRSGCAAVQFGASRDDRLDAMPTQGLGLSALTAAHELGHTLGLHHDGDGNSCSGTGFVMSSGSDSRRPAQGWSACSASAARRLWPGCLRTATAPPPPPPAAPPSLDGQCQLQLGDLLAEAAADSDPCRKLLCETAPVRAIRDSLLDSASLEGYSGLLSPGPALEGSVCGEDSVCRSGRCARCAGSCPVQLGRWSDWEPLGGCRSPCYPAALGVQTLTRRCIGTDPLRPAYCPAGRSVRRILCIPRCPTRRQWRQDARRVCRESDPAAEPLRQPYDSARPAAACAVRCRTDTASGQVFWWPTDVFFGRDMRGDGPFLPDGMLCHRSAGDNFYCVGHRCTPQSEVDSF